MTVDVDIEDTEFMGGVKTRFALCEVQYETGGVTITPNDLGLNRFQSYIVEVADGSPYIVSYNEKEESLYVYEATGAADEATSMEEVGANTEVSVRFTGLGK